MLAWYSSPLGTDPPWLAGQFGPSWILAARLDFTRYEPSLCTPPPPDQECPPPPLPKVAKTALAGRFVLALAPVFFPDLPAFFAATAETRGERITLSLQGLDQRRFIEDKTPVPIGAAFRATGYLHTDGHFDLDFGSPQLPFAVYPLGGQQPLTFTFAGLQLKGATVSPDVFCGTVGGDVVVVPVPGVIPPNTRFRLAGSTFGATRAAVQARCP